MLIPSTIQLQPGRSNRHAVSHVLRRALLTAANRLRGVSEALMLRLQGELHEEWQQPPLHDCSSTQCLTKLFRAALPLGWGLPRR